MRILLLLAITHLCAMPAHAAFQSASCRLKKPVVFPDGSTVRSRQVGTSAIGYIHVLEDQRGGAFGLLSSRAENGICHRYGLRGDQTNTGDVYCDTSILQAVDFNLKERSGFFFFSPKYTDVTENGQVELRMKVVSKKVLEETTCVQTRSDVLKRGVLDVKMTRIQNNRSQSAVARFECIDYWDTNFDIERCQ